MSSKEPIMVLASSISQENWANCVLKDGKLHPPGYYNNTYAENQVIVYGELDHIVEYKEQVEYWGFTLKLRIPFRPLQIPNATVEQTETELMVRFDKPITSADSWASFKEVSALINKIVKDHARISNL